MAKNNVAISTAWNIDTRKNIREALAVIKKLGFRSIEAGYNFREERLEELIAASIDEGIEILTVHNFCPLPYEQNWGRFYTDLYRLSSPDASERMDAVDATRKTIDIANSIGAKAVIIHAGTVDIDNKYVKELFQLYKEGKRGSDEYELCLDRLIAERKAYKEPFMDAVIKSLDAITEHAIGCNIKIGLENRYYPNEIPNLDEAEYLLDIFGKKNLVYWHDVGHAAVQERLGINSQSEYLVRLKSFKDYLYGFHIHDVKGLSLNDHLAPFYGDIDFSEILHYMKGDVIKVIEAHQPATEAQVKQALTRLSQ